MKQRIMFLIMALVMALAACSGAEPTAGGATSASDATSASATDTSSERPAEGTDQAAGTYDVVEERVFDATPERVWRTLSESGEIMKWWGPHGWTASVEDADFREGGTTVVCMQAPGGDFSMCNTWQYRTVRPFSLIEYDVGWSDASGNPMDPAEIGGLPADIPETVPHRITLEDLGDGRTQMVHTEFGFRSQETADISRSGLLEVLDKMAGTLGQNEGIE